MTVQKTKQFSLDKNGRFHDSAGQFVADALVMSTACGLREAAQQALDDADRLESMLEESKRMKARNSSDRDHVKTVVEVKVEVETTKTTTTTMSRRRDDHDHESR